jgi:hypothetical protein
MSWVEAVHAPQCEWLIPEPVVQWKLVPFPEEWLIVFCLVPGSRIVESFDLLELTTIEWTALGESQFTLNGVQSQNDPENTFTEFQ